MHRGEEKAKAAKAEDSASGQSRGEMPLTKERERLSPDHPKVKVLAIALLFAASASSGFFGGWLSGNNNQPNSVQQQQVVLKSQGQVISHIAKNVGASVVSIETTTQGAAAGVFGFSQPTEQQGAGTGIILDKEGLIITNRHVVPQGTTRVAVTLSDGTKYDDVEVVGRTRSGDSLDIAFVKIKDTKGKDLTPASIGDSSKMQVGDPVVAIGNALGQFQNTVTSGILSGYGRSIQAGDGTGQNVENLEDLFQTDAAINQGNSGGPLVNLDGQVVGINTAIAGDAQNIGFAIPINDVSGLMKSVKETGELKRPYLGVVYVALTDDLAKQYDLSVKRGAYIPPQVEVGQDSVIDGGPADKVGLKEGDIITKVDGVSIGENNSLTALLGKHNVGDTVELTVVRDGKQQTFRPKLEAAPTKD